MAQDPGALNFYAEMRREPHRGHYMYVLEGHTPVPANEAFPTGNVLLQWAWWYERRKRAWARVRETHFGPRSQWRVSTVFLGLDHSFTFDGPPVLFETMVFGGPLDGWQDRYESWDAAVAGHRALLKLARAAVPAGPPRRRPRRGRRR